MATAFAYAACIGAVLKPKLHTELAFTATHVAHMSGDESRRLFRAASDSDGDPVGDEQLRSRKRRFVERVMPDGADERGYGRLRRLS